jgi:RimJ/RimL family protein N-acetyltransferase
MIYGDRIRLRAIERNDLPRFVEWLNDPEVIAGLEIYLPLSATVEENWFDQMLIQPAEQHPMVIEVRSQENWLAVGDCGFNSVDHHNHSGEIGIFIGRKDLWNRGYGTETMRVLLKHGFYTLNLHRIFLRVFETNQRAIRSYEKAGFVHEGRLRQAHYRNGKYEDVLFMSALKPEWQE